MSANYQIHYPVMLNEVLENLDVSDNKTYVDATFGNGGYSEAILNKANCKLIALDRDKTVLPRAEELKKQYLEALKTIIDWNDIDKEDCLLLGFGRWTDEDTYMKNLYLIPYCLHPIIPIGLKVWAIDGEQCEWQENFSKDIRFGMLAYGVMVNIKVVEGENK